AAPPVPAEASSVRSVRDALGNRGFACFLQAKLTVGHPDDPLEREADDVAEQVMRMPDESVSTQGMSPPAVQRKCAECEQEAEEPSRAMGARAYTFGTDVAFRAGEFSPETVDGQRLLAHELTHVIQQSDGRGIGGTIRRATGKEAAWVTRVTISCADNVIVF